MTLLLGNFLGVEAAAAFGMVWPAVFFCGLVGGVIRGRYQESYTAGSEPSGIVMVTAVPPPSAEAIDRWPPHIR